jgi:ABC-type glycerol-3-phosphate transport system substrate-binding protein
MHVVRLSRRTCLSLVVSGSVGLLAACGGAAAVTTSVTTSVSTAAPSSAASSAVPASSAAITSAGTRSAAPTTAATVATSSSVASTSAASAAAPTAKGLTLDFWNPAQSNDQPEFSIMQDLEAKFNQQEPTFQVKNSPIDTANNYEKYTAAIAGGAPPDLILTYDWDPVPGWAYQGALLSLDPYMAQMKINKGDYFPIVWSMLNLHGHFWGFLQEFDSNTLPINRSLFQKYGLDPTKPPKTIAEFDDLNVTLTQFDSSGAITQLGMVPYGPQGGYNTPWLAVFGGKFYDTLQGQFTIYRPENIAALDYLAGWRKKVGLTALNDFSKKNKSSTNSYANTFTLEKQAMMVMQSWQPIPFQKLFPRLAWANALLPVQPPVFYGTSTADAANVFVVPKGVAHPQQSVTLAKWMGGPEATMEWCVQTGGIPPITAVALGQDFAKQAPFMKAWLDIVALSKDQNHLVGAITHPAFQEFNKLQGPIWDDTLNGKISADAGLKQLEQVMQPVLAKYPGW